MVKEADCCYGGIDSILCLPKGFLVMLSKSCKTNTSQVAADYMFLIFWEPKVKQFSCDLGAFTIVVEVGESFALD